MSNSNFKKKRKKKNKTAIHVMFSTIKIFKVKCFLQQEEESMQVTYTESKNVDIQRGEQEE